MHVIGGLKLNKRTGSHNRNDRLIAVANQSLCLRNKDAQRLNPKVLEQIEVVTAAAWSLLGLIRVAAAG